MRDLGACLGRLPWEGRFHRRQASSQLRPTFRPEVGVPEPAPLSGPESQAWAPCGTPAPGALRGGGGRWQVTGVAERQAGTCRLVEP